MILRSFLALHSGLPSVAALGGEGPIPASVPPLVDLGTGLGMGVLSNGLLNEHPSFSVDSYALRAKQLECLRDGLERGRYLQDGGSPSLEESIH